MWTVFRHSLSRSRGQILGWGISLAILSAYLLSFYDTLIEQRAQLEQLLASYPPALMAFFGDFAAMFTPHGYLTVEFFSYMPLILGIFAILAGSGLLASDEESGTLDLLLAHPIRRSSMFFARFLAFLATMVGILGLTWAGFVVGLNWTTLELSWGELALPFLSLGAVLLVYSAFAILMSMLLPSRRVAAMAGGLLVIADFFITSLSRVDERLEAAARFFPLKYYQSGDAVLGLNWEWMGGLAGVALVMLLVAWWRFERRDIRVGGEGSWGLPRLRRRPAS
jgi:ABC-2 type transport system permease protein